MKRIIEGVKARQIPAALFFVGFSKAFDSFQREKMETILLAYGTPKEIATAIINLSLWEALNPATMLTDTS